MKIFVKVKPKAIEEKIQKVSDTNFKVWVRAIPEKGKANRAVLRALANYFDVSQSDIEIVSGSTSKLKVFEIKK